MRYTLTGKLNGFPSSLTWQDGRLSGDPLAVLLTKAAAAEMDGEPVGPPAGPYTDTKHLSDPLSTYFLVSEHVFPVEGHQGDVIPCPPELTGQGPLPTPTQEGGGEKSWVEKWMDENAVAKASADEQAVSQELRSIAVGGKRSVRGVEIIRLDDRFYQVFGRKLSASEAARRIVRDWGKKEEAGEVAKSPDDAVLAAIERIGGSFGGMATLPKLGPALGMSPQALWQALERLWRSGAIRMSPAEGRHGLEGDARWLMPEPGNPGGHALGYAYLRKGL